MSCIIFDIDGTLADCEHRKHFITKDNPRWDKFFEECHKDKPIKQILELSYILSRFYPLILTTGRPERIRKETKDWLDDNFVTHIELLMRKDNDHRPDEIVKEEMLQKIRTMKYEPLIVFDDRKKVVDMWRRNGLVCCQVAEGDF